MMKKLLLLLFVPGMALAQTGNVTFNRVTKAVLDPTPDQFRNANNLSPLTNLNLLLDIDRRIAGKNPSTDRVIFSTQTHTGTPSYVRNTGFWGYDIDLTCASVWNSFAGVERGGTAVTKRHIILAYHFDTSPNTPMPTDGTVTFRFITKANGIVDRTLVGKQRVGSTDILVGLLSADLPDTIQPAKVLPSNYANWLNVLDLPEVYTDAEEKGHVGEMTSPGGGFGTNQYNYATVEDPTRVTFYEGGVAGDSGNPHFLVWGATPILVGYTYSSTTAYTIVNDVSGINSAISSLGGGGSLAPIDPTYFLEPKLIKPSRILIGSSTFTKGSSVQALTTDPTWLVRQYGSGIGLQVQSEAGDTIMATSGTGAGAAGHFLGDSHAGSGAMILEGFEGGYALKAKIDGTEKIGIDGSGYLRWNATGPLDTAASGTPEGVVTAPIGSLYRRTNGSTGTALYLKETGSGNTGWVTPLTPDSTNAVTNKTVSVSNNTLVFKKYLVLTNPQQHEGTNAVIDPNVTNATGGHASFSGSVDKASNYVIYRIDVPDDIDTTQDLRVRFKFRLNAADTGSHSFEISMADIAD